nr:5-hydroxytryptamine receptor 1A-like [Halyomorpha halys]
MCVVYGAGSGLNTSTVINPRPSSPALHLPFKDTIIEAPIRRKQLHPFIGKLVHYTHCKLSKDVGYVLYSALGSFYIPSCIMVFVYIRIYYAAKARARRGIRKAVTRPRPDERVTSFSGRKEPRTPVEPNSPVASVIIEKPVIPVVTCDFASDISTSDNVDQPDTGKDCLKVQASLSPNVTFKGSTLSVNGDLAAVNRTRAPSVGIDADMVSEFDPSSSDSGVVSRCAVVKPLKLRLCKPIFGRKSSKAKRDIIDMGRISSAGSQDIPQDNSRGPKVRDPEREKRRLARKKEKRATLILGLIMGSFIACWLPFFFLYILSPVCGAACPIPDFAFAVAFWLGYMNSALNPVIYTIFNKDFRRAFRRILFK